MEKYIMGSPKEQSTEKLYEVLKFVEHGGCCRQSLDCVPGMLLIDCMKNNPVISKIVLFEWFRKIAVCAEQYERCGAGSNYRYLNPYGIVLSKEGEILLLDTEARENTEIMKQMQKRAVRSHFIRPIYDRQCCGRREVDLFSYGNTIRFLLAYMNVEPKLTGREAARLSRVIGRCIGETKRKYGDFGQILKELPVIRQRSGQPDKIYNNKKIRVGIAVGAAVTLIVVVILRGADGVLKGIGSRSHTLDAGEPLNAEFVNAGDGTGREHDERFVRTDDAVPEVRDTKLDRKDSDAQGGSETKFEKNPEGFKEADGAKTADTADTKSDLMDMYLNQHTENGNKKAIEIGEKERLSIVWKLVDAYEQCGMQQEQIDLYGELIELEKDPVKLEEAGVRKMELEAEMGCYEQAVETGRKVLWKIKESELIVGMMNGCAYEMERHTEHE